MSQMLPAYRRAASRRGAASVETAICMLVIIPVFLYSLFLDDLLRYSLDVQEAAISTVWDLTVQDYSSKGDPGTVQRHARLMFCDHESGLDRYNATTGDGKYRDCEDRDHHTAVAAHVCWLNDDAEQVTCEGPDKSVGDVGADGLYNSYHSEFTNGGMYRCRAKAVVENYLLPKKFLPEFSDDDGEEHNLTKKRWTGDVHDNSTKGKGGWEGDAYYIKEQHLAILTDTWALTDAVNIEPGQKDTGNALYQRVANVYQNPQNVGFTEMNAQASNFFSTAMNNDLLSPALVGGLVAPWPGSREIGGILKPDDPRQPNISIKAANGAPTQTIDQGSEGSGTYFNSEWRDWDNDRTQKTYDKRGAYYMGCKNPEEC